MALLKEFMGAIFGNSGSYDTRLWHPCGGTKQRHLAVGKNKDGYIARLAAEYVSKDPVLAKKEHARIEEDKNTKHKNFEYDNYDYDNLRVESIAQIPQSEFEPIAYSKRKKVSELTDNEKKWIDFIEVGRTDNGTTVKQLNTNRPKLDLKPDSKPDNSYLNIFKNNNDLFGAYVSSGSQLLREAHLIQPETLIIGGRWERASNLEANFNPIRPKNDDDLVKKIRKEFENEYSHNKEKGKRLFNEWLKGFTLKYTFNEPLMTTEGDIEIASPELIGPKGIKIELSSGEFKVDPDTKASRNFLDSYRPIFENLSLPGSDLLKLYFLGK